MGGVGWKPEQQCCPGSNLSSAGFAAPPGKGQHILRVHKLWLLARG